MRLITKYKYSLFYSTFKSPIAWFYVFKANVNAVFRYAKVLFCNISYIGR